MSGSGIRVRAVGTHEAKEAMESVIGGLKGRPLLDGFREATMLVVTGAKRNAPVDTGRLRSSITGEVRFKNGLLGKDVEGVAGTNVDYAPYMEFGTGTFVGRAPHYPPPGAIALWSRRHGLNPYVVALSIYRKGGLQGRHFLQKAFDDNKTRIVDIIGDAVTGIVRRAT